MLKAKRLSGLIRRADLLLCGGGDLCHGGVVWPFAVFEYALMWETSPNNLYQLFAFQVLGGAMRLGLLGLQ